VSNFQNVYYTYASRNDLHNHAWQFLTMALQHVGSTYSSVYMAAG